jgi:hypothetical protein
MGGRIENSKGWHIQGKGGGLKGTEKEKART